jgi:hypothetical protein
LNLVCHRLVFVVRQENLPAFSVDNFFTQFFKPFSMMRFFQLLLLFGIFATATASAQTGHAYWTDVPEAAITMPESAEREVVPQQYRTLKLDLRGLRKALSTAPQERALKATPARLLLDMPMPDGSVKTFDVWESSVMQPGLAARYPQIRTFAGRSVDGAIIRFDLGEEGFHGAMRTFDGTYYIDPYASGQDAYYISYDVKDHILSPEEYAKLTCGYDPLTDPQYEESFPERERLQPGQVAQRGGKQTELRTYVLALACTGEYGSWKGGTVQSVLSTFNTAVNRINILYQPEFAVKLVLHEFTDRLIFLDANIDPYINANQGISLLNQNPAVVNARIDIATYDVGHVFTRACTDVGGVASGANVCSEQNKAKGVTCHFSSSVTYIAIEITAHEIGHQFSASHTFDNCPSGLGPGQRSGTGYEPGSGSTIMSYAGSCGAQNIQNNSDDYFHGVNLEQMMRYSRERTGSECPDVEAADNREPDVFLSYSDNFYIPKSTPFELTASASDPDGDPLQYSWEQFDAEINATDIGFPKGNCPMYRSYRPTTNPTRMFPRLDYLLRGETSPVEMLPNYARDFTFRVTVRDNHPVAGGVVWDEVRFKTSDKAGPFVVVYPNADTIVWRGGEEVEVSWDVAGTDQSPVNCKFVNIRLSIDGGNTFPILLSEKTPNDGSDFVFVPSSLTTQARVRIEAADNIFFNISNSNFSIQAATEPGYAVRVSPQYSFVCLPAELIFDIKTESYLSFSSPISLDIANSNAIPDGMSIMLPVNPIAPGQNAEMRIVAENRPGLGSVEVVLRAIAGTDTVERVIKLVLVSNDFSTLRQIQPANGIGGVTESPAFIWTGSADARTYEFQLATSPAFRPEDIVLLRTNLADTTFKTPGLLEENRPYYWRIRPANVCGAGDYLPVSAFHTIAKSCKQYVGLEGENQRISITGLGLPVRESVLTLLEDGAINDLNIPNIKGSYDPVSSIRLTLLSPKGTKAVLFEKRCTGSVFNFGFDDAILSRNPCPTNDGNMRGPQEFLEIFNGEEISGSWILRIEVVERGNGGGGSLDEWTVEFCGNLSVVNPLLVRNDTMPVPPGKSRQITRDFLEVQSDIAQPDELTFTVVSLPAHGQLFLSGQALRIGDNFRQSSIDAGNLSYRHDGSDTKFDGFTYTVLDGKGGWLAIPQFNIVIDPNAVVSTKAPEIDREILLFPNPAADQVNLKFGIDFGHSLQVSVVNAQGQTLQTHNFRQAAGTVSFSTSGLGSGLYFALLQTEKGNFVRKFRVQR